MYNDLTMYIKTLVQINAQEFEKGFYMTMKKNLMKLWAIWEACGKPNSKSHVHDGKRGKAVMMVASALDEDGWKEGNIRQYI